MSETNFQVVIVGAGPGGYVCAIRCAQLGFKTALVEKRKALGGTCLNIGCIPSKALLHSSELYHEASHSFASLGIKVDKVSLDLAKMLQRKDKVVTKLTMGLKSLMKKNKVEVFEGEGSLASANEVLVKDGSGETKLQAERIVLASGSAPVGLPFMPFDGERVVSSTEALAFQEIPKSLLVVGAGAIGLEMGSVWARLGTEVTIVEFLPRIAALGFDADVSQPLQKSLQSLGIKFHTDTKVEACEVKKDSVTLTGKKGEESVELKAEKVLVAVGRKPFTEGLGLDKAGVALTERGRIQTDEAYQTSVPGIYAIGDVINGPMLAHKAEEDGVALAEKLAGKPGHTNPGTIPSIIYTHPEAASVGLTEEKAKEKGIGIKTGKFPFMANGRAIASESTEGFAKIIADAKTDRLLGAQILGANASEMIAECVSVMEFGGSAEDIARTVHGHPTMSEAIKEAALAVDSRSLHS